MNRQTVNTSQWETLVAKSERFDIETKKSFQKLSDKKVLVACSGGGDSVALAILFKSFDVDFGLAYIDHGINLETRNSEVVVKDLSMVCGVPFFTSYLDMGDNELANSNIEANAREHRYIALEEIRSTHGYQLVATAHHLDDFAETYLINLIRGSGSGVASLAESRDYLVRPILNWRKKELLDLVEKCGLDFFEDEMNADPRFVRNRIRNEAIALLSDISSRDVIPLIARAARNISKDTKYLEALAASEWPKGTASTRDLVALDPVLQTHALRAWIDGYPPSIDELDRILAVARHEIVSTQLSGNRTKNRCCFVSGCNFVYSNP